MNWEKRQRAHARMRQTMRENGGFFRRLALWILAGLALAVLAAMAISVGGQAYREGREAGLRTSQTQQLLEGLCEQSQRLAERYEAATAPGAGAEARRDLLRAVQGFSGYLLNLGYFVTPRSETFWNDAALTDFAEEKRLVHTVLENLYQFADVATGTSLTRSLSLGRLDDLLYEYTARYGYSGARLEQIVRAAEQTAAWAQEQLDGFYALADPSAGQTLDYWSAAVQGVVHRLPGGSLSVDGAE